MDEFVLKIDRLAPSLVIKGFVEGLPNCNYEIYLRELLNRSLEFSLKGGSPFVPPLSEESGQCDAISDNYELDFKLLASQTDLMARSILEPQPYVPTKGVTFWMGSKNPDGRVTITRIYAAFRDWSLSDLEEIRSGKTNRTNTDNDIPQILETVETKKNLLLFFPFALSFQKEPDLNQAVEEIQKALSSDFRELFRYREKHSSGFDTYFTVVYDSQFLLFRVDAGSLYYLESIGTSDLPTYVKLSEYTDVFL